MTASRDRVRAGRPTERPLLVLLLGLGLWVSVAAPLAAQQRPVEQITTADGVRLDFPPGGVWRVKARRVAEQRSRMLSQGRLSAMNVAQAVFNGGVLQGTLYVPTILIAFKNTTVASLPDTAQYNQIYYTTTPLAGRSYTMRTFYEEMSHGVFSVQGQTFGWTAADSNDTYYLEACGASSDPLGCSPGRARLGQLLTKALQGLDGTINFADYDNDGPDGIPRSMGSSDDDGQVDVVQFAQPVVGRECSGPGYNAHRAYLSVLGAPAYSTGDGVIVNSYTFVSGVGGLGCTDPSQIEGIGTSAHEMGHGIGLPDLYDVNSLSKGVGEFSLMGSGNYRSLNSPAHFDAWSLQQVGWVTVRELTANGAYSLGPVEKDADTVFMVRPAGSNPRGEFYLLENKRAMQSDSSNMLHGPFPKTGGLLIWHVDSTKIAQGSPSNQVNTGSIHGLALVQADGLNELSVPEPTGDRGDAGDPYPGTSNNQRFSYNTTPANVKNSDGSFAGFEIAAITRSTSSDSGVSFTLAFGGLTIVRAIDTTAQVSVDATKYHRFAQLLTPSTTHTIAIDSAQVTSDSLKQFLFQSWSDAGARSHDITAQLAGDSVSAALTVRFRVRATASGSGSITATPPGNVAAGVYVLKDSVISLKATAAAGKFFGGWSGDTTSSADSIQITASKAYTVVANFQDSLVASLGTPPAPVMGKSYSHTLTATGGSGNYTWQVTSGALPDGLTLGTGGVITGIPSKAGDFTATARVTSPPQTDSVTVPLTVTEPTLVTGDVVSQLLGTRAPLTADQLKYLDLLGNANGGFDAGDFLAWVNATGAPAPAMAPVIADTTAARPAVEPAPGGARRR